MSIFNTNSAEILIVLFFIITYFISVFEKLADWKGTVTYYSHHFKNTFIHKYISIALINILIFEITAFALLIVGLYYLFFENNFSIVKVGLEISAITLLQFLIGQRLAKDYPGAMNITIYFILNIIGIYILT